MYNTIGVLQEPPSKVIKIQHVVLAHNQTRELGQGDVSTPSVASSRAVIKVLVCAALVPLFFTS